MTLLLNILWFIFGGFLVGTLWLFAGALMAITIVGLPWSFAAWRIASFAYWPFGRTFMDRDLVTGRRDIGTGCLGVFLNVLWFLVAGWYIALSHLTLAAAQAITIIGIPFAYKNLQLAVLALAPVGKTLVDKP